MISVIVPIYNIEDYVKKCIHSIQIQTYKDFELILVDDGSKDTCPKICDEAAAEDRRIKVIHKQNGGLVSARKAGLNAASGDYVLFIDGDDWILPSCLEKINKIIVHYSPELICFGAKYIYSNKEMNRSFSSIGVGSHNREEIIKYLFPLLIENENGQHLDTNIWGKVFLRTRLLECYNFVSDEITMGEDGVVTRPYIYKSNSLFVIKDCLYCYNQCNNSSMTKALKPIPWNNTKLIRDSLQKTFEIDEYFKEQLNRNTLHNLFITAISQFNSKNSYISICSDIKKNLQKKEYKFAIDNCKYSSLTWRMINFVISHRLCFIIYLYSKMR